MNVMINTLEFAEAFEQAGFAHDQAKALASAFGKAQDVGRDELVTKDYLKAELAKIEMRLVKQIADVGKDISGRLWSTIAIIAGVSTAISATIGAGMAILFR